MKLPDFKALKKGKTLTLEIYDQIGPSWAGMIDAKSVARAVSEAGDVDTINVHINSPGGSVFEGVAIHNMLKNHAAKVHVVVDGVAASIASIVAMAGDTIKIPRNALLMIHNPSAVAWGEQNDLQKTADLLGKIKSQLVETYAARSKKPADELIRMMDEETWFTGAEAVEAGFADDVTAELSLTNVAAAGEMCAAFRRAPSNFSTLAALSTSKPPKEIDVMPDVKTPEQIAAEVKADLDAKAVADKAAIDAKAKQDADVKAAGDNERKRAADIMAVCNQAGKPDLAAEFIANGTDLSAVQAHVIKVLCEARPPVDDGKGADLIAKGEDAAYKAEYAKNKADYPTMSEEAYVKVRRLEDGKDALKTKAAA